MKRNLLLFSLIIIISACLKTKNYPPVPVIEYKDFVQFGSDSAHLIFSFKDGDGDIGIDTLSPPPFNNASNRYYYNLYKTYYYKLPDGTYSVYVKPGTQDTTIDLFRIPNLTPKGQNKVLEGDITVNLNAPYYYPEHTSIKFEFFIYDRAFHKSNVVSTPEIILGH